MFQPILDNPIISVDQHKKLVNLVIKKEHLRLSELSLHACLFILVLQMKKDNAGRKPNETNKKEKNDEQDTLEKQEYQK